MDNKSLKKQFVAPLICGQILFLQVSINTSTARPDASTHSRRRDVRAKNLRGKIKTSERKVLLILHKPQQRSTVQQFSADFLKQMQRDYFLLLFTYLHSVMWLYTRLPIYMCWESFCTAVIFVSKVKLHCAWILKPYNTAQLSDHNIWNFVLHSNVATSMRFALEFVYGMGLRCLGRWFGSCMTSMWSFQAIYGVARWRRVDGHY